MKRYPVHCRVPVSMENCCCFCCSDDLWWSVCCCDCGLFSVLATLSCCCAVFDKHHGHLYKLSAFVVVVPFICVCCVDIARDISKCACRADTGRGFC